MLDDRDGTRPGVKFADAELIGIPHRIVIGDRGLKDDMVEYRLRSNDASEDVKLAEIISRVTAKPAA